MAAERNGTVIDHLQRLFNVGASYGALPDRVLLNAFVRRRVDKGNKQKRKRKLPSPR